MDYFSNKESIDNLDSYIKQLSELSKKIDRVISKINTEVSEDNKYEINNGLKKIIEKLLETKYSI